MKKEEVKVWFETECSKSGLDEKAAQTPFYQKWVAFSLLLSVPVVLTGCGDQEFTAQDECEWERDVNGKWELDCDDDSSSYYRSHGYTSKSSPVHSTSPLYKKGVGSGGSKSGGFFSGG